MIEPSKYNLDLTGEAPANKITGEQHKIESTGGNRAVVLDNGAFYTRSLVVRDVASGRILTRGVDYLPACLIPSPTAASGKEVCGYFVVTNTEVSDNIEVSYQLVGGFYIYSSFAIDDLLKTLGNDDRKVSYNAIKNKPAGMPPGLHFHDLGDVYGFGFVIYVLEKIREAIIDADDPAWVQLLAYLASVRLSLETAGDLLRQSLQAHISQRDPHNLTAAQAGAASSADVTSAINTITSAINSRVTEVTTLINSLLTSVNTHINDLSTGAHGVTIASIGAVSATDVANRYNNAINAINGVVTARTSGFLGRVSGQNEHTNGILHAKWYNNFVAGIGTAWNGQVNAALLTFNQIDDPTAKSFYMLHNQANTVFSMVLSGVNVLDIAGGERIAKLSDAQSMIGSMLRV